MSSDKKAIVIGQVFIFIIAAITFALIMIFGYGAISDFIEKGETVEFYQFKSDLETSIKKIYTEYGSVREKTFVLPTKYEQICFVDLSKVSPPDCTDKLNDVYACDVWDTAGGSYDGADENVFLDPIAPVKIKVFKISMGSDSLCLKVDKGRFKLRLEGKGDRTHLSEVK